MLQFPPESTYTDAEKHNFSVAEAFMSGGYSPTDQALVSEYLALQPPGSVYVEPPARVTISRQQFEAGLSRLAEIVDKPPRQNKRLLAKEIRREICTRHGISLAEMDSPRRYQKFVRARQEAMYWISKRCGYSLPVIGRLFGDRDHTTVLHGIRQHAKRLGIK